MGSEPPAARIAELVEEALALDPAARGAFLSTACAGDFALRLEVESLLGYQNQARGFLETPVFALDVASVAADATGGELQAGDTLGDCEILSLLGEGGMGEVYLARDTVLDRRVAVKLLRRGAGADTIIRRFRHERRVLAALNHPHIARLYGGEVTPDGRPFLVMEYVEGERLDVYCDGRQLPVAARLALFRKVCSAVACAHQNLVIHRDLKPGNILVTADGEPKLLDFGIAKLLDLDATEGPDATMTLAAAMTPGYASPEQLRGDPITTASDIYSLGVVLYELLTGQRPHHTTGRVVPAEFARVLESQPTERPSAVVARTATEAEGKLPVCGESPERLRRHLSGDLDNIVLMAMRREPARRYVSASQLSEDLRRHCEGLPVMARRDTLGYRTGKFVRRNKVAVAAAVLLILSLLAGVVATTRQAARANRRFDDVRRLANSILFEVDPLIANLPGSMAARTALVRHALEYLDSLSTEAGGDHGLRRELATAYEKVGDVQGNPAGANVGDIKGALASYAKARGLRLALAVANPREGRLRHELAGNEEQTGYMLWWTDQTARALAEYDAALALRRTLLAEEPRSPDYRRGMALLEMRIGDVPAWTGDTPRAMAAFNVARPLLQGLAAEQPADAGAQTALARCLSRIGDTLKDAGDFDGALASLAQAQGIVEPVVQRDPNAADAQGELWFIVFKRCELYLTQPAGDKAAALGPEMVALAARMAQRDANNIEAQHKLADSHSYYAQACLLVERDEDAIAEFGKALEIDAALFAKSPQTIDFQRACANHRCGMAKAQLRLGRFDEAFGNLQAAGAVLEPALAADPGNLMWHHDLGDVCQQLGKTEAARGHPAEARGAYAKAIAHFEAFAAGNPPNKRVTDVLAELHHDLGELPVVPR